MTATDRPTSPGWMCPPSPTRADVARIEGTIISLDASVRCYEQAKHERSAARAATHARVWRERLAEVKTQIASRREAVA